jgi:dihydroxy-acid dehydratase
LTPAALRNALTVLQAIGGSTNALVHFTAVAGRLGIAVDLEAFDAIGREVPVLVDLKPSGEHYMEHRTVGGVTIADIIAAAEEVPGQDVIRPRERPIMTGGGLAVLHGNLAPGSALIKRSAASPGLLRHEGRAVVFESVGDMVERIDDESIGITADDVIVMRNAGPKGAPGMPEAGYIPIPRYLARAGVKDMVRISDARMSGTAFGTIVLHLIPESAVGGPLGLVRTGDRIRLDAEARTLDLLVDEAELAARRAAWVPPAPPPGAERGYLKLYLDEVLQADQGCDFRFCLPAPPPGPLPQGEGVK